MQTWLAEKWQNLYGALGGLLLCLYGVMTYLAIVHGGWDAIGLGVLAVLIFAVGYGLWGGLLSALVIVLTKTILFSSLGVWDLAAWQSILQSGAGPNLLILLGIGAGVGGLMDLSRHNAQAIQRYKKAEERLVREAEINTAIARLSNLTLTSNAFDGIAQPFLNTILDLTASRRAVIISLDPESGVVLGRSSRDAGLTLAQNERWDILWQHLHTLHPPHHRRSGGSPPRRHQPGTPPLLPENASTTL